MVAAPAKKAVRRRTKIQPDRHWTFLTNHATVLLHIAGHSDDTMRSIAAALGLTERTTATAIAELRVAGYINVQRRGRHNHYTVNGKLPLRRPAHTLLHVHDLLATLETVGKSQGSVRHRPNVERRPTKTG